MIDKLIKEIKENKFAACVIAFLVILIITAIIISKNRSENFSEDDEVVKETFVDTFANLDNTFSLQSITEKDKEIIEYFPTAEMNVMYSDANGNLATTQDLGLKNLTVSGDSQFGGNVNIMGKTSINNGNLMTNGNLGVGGNITTDSNIYAKGNLDVNDTNIRGSVNVAGTINSGGAISSNANLVTKRGRLSFMHPTDPNHTIYNNYTNIDGEGGWDGMKMNTYAGLDIRTGNANGAVPKKVLSVRDGEVNVNGKLRFRHNGANDGDDSDPYYLEKVGGNNDNHLRLTINDDANESFQIWGGSCAAGDCNGAGKMKHTFDAMGNASHVGSVMASGGGWNPAIKINAPADAGSLYSIHFGDGSDIHGRQTGMGYIKDQPNKLFGSGGSLATHIHQNDDWMLYSTNWDPLVGIKGGSGDMKVKGNMTAASLSTTGNIATNRNRLGLNTTSDANHTIYNNNNNIDGEGGWDGMKMNTYAGLDIRTGNANGAVPKNVMSVRDGGATVYGDLNVTGRLNLSNGWNIRTGDGHFRVYHNDSHQFVVHNPDAGEWSNVTYAPKLRSESLRLGDTTVDQTQMKYLTKGFYMQVANDIPRSDGWGGMWAAGSPVHVHGDGRLASASMYSGLKFVPAV